MADLHTWDFNSSRLSKFSLLVMWTHWFVPKWGRLCYLSHHLSVPEMEHWRHTYNRRYSSNTPYRLAPFCTSSHYSYGFCKAEGACYICGDPWKGLCDGTKNRTDTFIDLIIHCGCDHLKGTRQVRRPELVKSHHRFRKKPQGCLLSSHFCSVPQLSAPYWWNRYLNPSVQQAVWWTTVTQKRTGQEKNCLQYFCCNYIRLKLMSIDPANSSLILYGFPINFLCGEKK